MDTTHTTRGVNVICRSCSGPMHFALGQARCVNDHCPDYWKGQGGIETLEPSQGYIPNQQRAVTVILKPQDM